MAIQQISDTAFTSSTVNNQTVYTSAESQTIGSNDSLVSGDITQNVSAKKFILDFEITTAYNDVAAKLEVEGSLDGTNWGVVDSLSSDTDPHNTGRTLYIVDLTSYTSIPLLRIHFNSGALGVGTSGKCKFRYAFTS